MYYLAFGLLGTSIPLHILILHRLRRSQVDGNYTFYGGYEDDKDRIWRRQTRNLQNAHSPVGMITIRIKGMAIMKR